MLLKKGADVAAEDWKRSTALHGAAGNGHKAVISLLLENGADIEMEEISGCTPLVVAIDIGSEEVIKLLLAKGAKVDYLYWIIVSEPGPSLGPPRTTSYRREAWDVLRTKVGKQVCKIEHCGFLYVCSFSQLELRSHFLHPGLPYPLLSACSLDAFIDPPQLQCESRSEFLQACSDILDTFNDFAVWSDDALLGFALVSEDISVSSDEYVISLVMERYDLSAPKLWLRWKQASEKMRCKQPQGCAEVVQDQLRSMRCGVPMAWHLLSLHPIAH